MTFISSFICRNNFVKDQDPGVHIYIDIDTAVWHKYLEHKHKSTKCSDFAKATLHLQMSVHLFVCHRNPSTAWNHHPSSFILQHSSFFIHPSFILRLLSFSAGLKIDSNWRRSKKVDICINIFTLLLKECHESTRISQFLNIIYWFTSKSHRLLSSDNQYNWEHHLPCCSCHLGQKSTPRPEIPLLK